MTPLEKAARALCRRHSEASFEMLPEKQRQAYYADVSAVIAAIRYADKGMLEAVAILARERIAAGRDATVTYDEAWQAMCDKILEG